MLTGSPRVIFEWQLWELSTTEFELRYAVFNRGFPPGPMEIDEELQLREAHAPGQGEASQKSASTASLTFGIQSLLHQSEQFFQGRKLFFKKQNISHSDEFIRKLRFFPLNSPTLPQPLVTRKPTSCLSWSMSASTSRTDHPGKNARKASPASLWCEHEVGDRSANPIETRNCGLSLHERLYSSFSTPLCNHVVQCEPKLCPK